MVLFTRVSAGAFSLAAFLARHVPFILLSTATVFTSAAADSATGLRFEIFPPDSIPASATNGRLFVILARENSAQPRLALGRTGRDAPQSLAVDVPAMVGDKGIVLDNAAYSFPATNLSSIPAGEYFVQAVFDYNHDLRLP